MIDASTHPLLLRPDTSRWLHFHCLLRARFLSEKKHEQRMIQLAFEYFDKDRSGYITSDEFVSAMSELGDPLTEQEVATFLKHFDVDSDGKVRPKNDAPSHHSLVSERGQMADH